MEIDSDFKSRFYNLQGIHLNERKRNFNKLLRSTSLDISQEEIDISPRNYQEKLFYVDVLIHFKRINKLIDILKEGDDAVTSRILKHSWFFERVFTDMKNEDIVNKFLPEFCYSSRLKILKKLSKIFSEERMDDLFDYILNRYGIFIAQEFLFSCSSDKVIHIMKNHQVKLHPGLLKRILHRNPNLIKVYFEEYQKNTGLTYSDSRFLQYAIWKEPIFFYELGEEYTQRIKVGRCTTKRIIQLDKDRVVNDFEKFKNKIKAREVVKKVPDFGKKILPQYFPPEKDTLISYYFRSDLIYVLKSLPKKVRWTVLSTTFEQKYKANIMDHLKLFDEAYVEFFPAHIKNKWAEEKFSSNNYYYLKYLEPKTGIQLIKDKINFTSENIQLRRLLVGELINVCCGSKDLSSLRDVLKYICQRHRNDHDYFRSVIFGMITGVLNTKLALDDTHWNYINELVDVDRARGLSLSFDIITQYIFYIYNKKCPLEGTLLQYIKDCLEANKPFRLYENTNLECEGVVLKSIGKMLPNIQIQLNREILDQLFHDITSFNQTAKQYKIDINEIPVLVEYIEALCQKTDTFDRDDYFAIKTLLMYNLHQPEKQLKVCSDTTLLNIIKTANKDRSTKFPFDGTKELFLRTKRTPFEEHLLRHYFTEGFDVLLNFEKKEITEYFIRNEPSIIQRYYATILHFDSKESFLQYGEIKKLGHLGLDRKLIDYFKPLAAVENQLDNKKDILRALSNVMNSGEFLDLVKGYVPTSRKLDLQNNEQREMYQVQCVIAKSFVNLTDYVKLSTVLFEFCQGDYLKPSLPALYKTMYHLDEAHVKHNLGILSKRAVSTRKHAIIFCFQLLPAKAAIDIYTSMSTKETNASARKAYTTSILKYFLRNSTESLLDMVLTNITLIDKNDSELIDHFIEAVPQIPNKFKSIFIEKLWKFTEELLDKTYQEKLLTSIQNLNNEVFSTISPELYQDVITTHFLQETDLGKGTSLDSFVIRYLEVNPEEERFIFVFDIVQKYKAKCCGVKNKEKLSKIFSFFENNLITFSDKTINFINLFKTHWDRVFSPVEAFFHCVVLKLFIVYQQKHDLHHFTTNVNKTCQELILTYGPLILESLAHTIKGFFDFRDFTCAKEFNLAQFTLHLLQYDSSEYNCFIAVNLLKNFLPQGDITVQIWNILEKSDCISIKMYCNSILNS